MRVIGRDAHALTCALCEPEWKECHEVSHLLSHHRLHQSSDIMKFSNLLPLPGGLHRKRSKAGSDIGPIEGQNEPDFVTPVPRPVESTPDLRIKTLTSPTSGPSTSRGQESNGMQTPFFRTSHLTITLLVQHRPTLLQVF